MTRVSVYFPEVREDAVRTVRRRRGKCHRCGRRLSQLPPKIIGCVLQTLHDWVQHDGVNSG
jgi:hypothetical protein